ncbi:winged helix-turn-helix transcriptional regulator [Rugosimonospora acidiphila]|uniref:Winged helix-turn-helix transcriptional regulator n=1 Tax=Rugosimonospora acidiphila TaxID=556531 RepID=A0ABP9RJN6_9ACTN
MAERRHYGQFCGLASALDVVGERWTILILRELLIGPCRFNDIFDNLPGIGPNILTERLRMLADEGVITSEVVPNDKRGRSYRLTPLGEQLGPPILGLAHWGMGRLTEEAASTEASRAAWGFLAVQAMMDARRIPEVTESYEFRVDGEAFHISVEQGTAKAARGPAPDPVLVITTDAVTFIRIGAQLVSAFDAVISGLMKAQGDPAAVLRCTTLLGLR